MSESEIQPVHVAATIQVPEDFPTISAAIDVAEDGDRILVGPGEYVESIIFNKNVSIAGHQGPASGCMIVAKDSTAITFCAQKGSLSNMSLKVDDTSNFFHCLVVESGMFELQGCELTGGAWGICVNNKANAIVGGCNVHDNKGTGVNVYGGASMTLTESEISFNRGRGVSISDQGTMVKLQGCNIHHCSDGVYVYGKARLEMDENYVHSNQDSGVTVHENGTTACIRRNYMHRNGWGGIRVYSGASAEIHDNDLQGNQSGALAVDRLSQAVVNSSNNIDAEAAPPPPPSPSPAKAAASGAAAAAARVALGRVN